LIIIMASGLVVVAHYVMNKSYTRANSLIIRPFFIFACNETSDTGLEKTLRNVNQDGLRTFAIA